MAWSQRSRYASVRRAARFSSAPGSWRGGAPGRTRPAPLRHPERAAPGDRQVRRHRVPAEVTDGLLDGGVRAGHLEGRPELLQGLRDLALPAVDFGDAADGAEIVGGRPQDVVQLALGGLDVADLEQGAPQRHPGRQVARVPREAGPADLDGFLEAAGPAVLLRQLGEGNRPRVLLEPLPQRLDAGLVCHAAIILPGAARPESDGVHRGRRLTDAVFVEPLAPAALRGGNGDGHLLGRAALVAGIVGHGEHDGVAARLPSRPATPACRTPGRPCRSPSRTARWCARRRRSMSPR